jgi:hypothetical protein
MAGNPVSSKRQALTTSKAFGSTKILGPSMELEENLSLGPLYVHVHG